MHVLTLILVWLALASFIALMVILIIKKIMLALSQSRKLVKKALYKELLKHCENNPNKKVKLEMNGDIIFVEFIPKKVGR